MRALSSLTSLSRTDHEFLWLSAAGWLATGFHRKIRPPRRIGVLGTAPTLTDHLALTTAMDALGFSVTTAPAQLSDGTEADLLGELCDALISWDPALRPANQDRCINADSAAESPVHALAIGVRHVLSGRSLRGAAVSTDDLPAGLQTSLTELAQPFGLCLHVNLAHPRPDLLERLRPPARVSLEPVSPVDGVDTSPPSVRLLAATWCALLEVLDS